MLSDETGEVAPEAARAARVVEDVVGNAWATDAAGRFVYVTEGQLALLGIAREDLNAGSDDPAAGWKHLVHPDDFAPAAAAWRASLETGVAYDVTHRLRAVGGVYRWGRCSGRPLRDAEGRILGWYGTVLDRDSLPIGREPVAVEAEAGAARAPSAFEMVHPEDRPAAIDGVTHAFWTGLPRPIPLRLQQPDGDYRWESATVVPPQYGLDGQLTWLGEHVDLEAPPPAPQPAAARALTTSPDTEAEAARAVAVIETLFGSAWTIDPDGKLTYLTSASRSNLEQTIEALNAAVDAGDTSWKPHAHPDDYEGLAAAWRHCLRSGDNFYYEHRVKLVSGYAWNRSVAYPIRDGQGRITGWYGTSITTDVYKRNEEALRERERQLQQLVDAVPALIWSTAPDGTLAYINKRLADTVGVALDDLFAPDGSRSLADIHPDDRSDVESALTQAFATGVAFRRTYRQRRADGGYRWTEGRLEPLRSEAGEIIHWYGVCVDVHDRVVAQEALEAREREQARLYSDIAEREARIRRLVESDIIGIVIWDLDGTLIDANDAFLDMVQYDRADVAAGIRWFDMTPPEWQAVHAQEEAEELAATGKMQAREKEYFRKDGTRVPVLIGAACFEGQSRQGVAYILDLTETKRAEASVRDRERELSQLVDLVPSHVWRLTPDGQPTFFNKRMTDYLGGDVDDPSPLLSNGLEGLIAAVHPDDGAAFRRVLADSLATGEPFAMRYRLRRADGVWHWMSSRAEPLRDPTGRILQWYGVCHDIDDQVRAEAALQLREQELKRLVDTVPAMIWCTTPEGRPSYFNRRMTEVVGVSVADLITPEGSRSLADIHPDHRAEVDEALARAFATGTPLTMTFRQLRSDGSYRWTEARAEPLRDDTGDIRQWYGVCVDIDDRMSANETLREREKFLWHLVETLPAMVDCAAPDGEPIYRSQQLREFLGYDLESLGDGPRSRLAQTLDAGVHPDDLASVKRDYAHSLATGEPYARRHRLRRFDGAYRWMETRAAPMRDASGAIVQWNVICLDIDGEVRAQEDLRLAQERLARASQAASLAELSASIAHEVNQPLAAVVWNSQACQRWLTAAPPNLDRAQTTIERIIRDANAAADVVSRIRALFSQAVEARHPAAIGDVIAEVRRLLADRTSQAHVELDTRVAADLPAIPFDVVQVQQVLVNLMRNAIDAIDGQDAPRLVVRAFRAGEMLQVEVSDNGPGVPNREKVFDAFFTTKPSGMGMGLAICRSIVESHGGRLWVESNAEGGATFAFTLPIQAVSPS